MEKQILVMLYKISKQLEEVSEVQQEVKAEMAMLYRHILELQDTTIKHFENMLPDIPLDSILN